MARTKKRFQAIPDAVTHPLEQKQDSCVWRVGLYARLSVENAARPSESIASQLEIMRQYLKERSGFSEIYEYTDSGFSGTNFHRPSFEAMMEDVRAGKINCVIVKDLSRLGRDYLETSNLLETIFPFLGVRFISVNDHFDSAAEYSGNKDLEIALKNLINDMYAKDVSKRLVVARRQEMERGRFTAREAPYGYCVDVTHPLRRFVVDPPAAEVVRRIYDMALAGQTLREIAAQLQEERLSIPGLYRKTGSLYLREEDQQKQWYIGTLSNILKNPAYIGNLAQGRKSTRLCEGKKRTFTDPQNWIVIEHAHEAIINQADYEKVQQILSQKAAESDFSSDRLKHLPIKPNKYQGILYCGICGKPLTYLTTVGSKDQDSRTYAFACRAGDMQYRENHCSVYIREKVLDKLVGQMLNDVLARYGGADPIISMLNAVTEKLLKSMHREQGKLSARLALAERETADAYEAFVLGRCTQEQYLKIRQEAEDKQVPLRKKSEELREKEAGYQAVIRQKKDWLRGLKSARQEELDADLLGLLISRINLYPKRNVEIIYQFGEEDFDKEMAE